MRTFISFAAAPCWASVPRIGPGPGAWPRRTPGRFGGTWIRVDVRRDRRAARAPILRKRQKNHSFGGCATRFRHRKVLQDRATSPLPGNPRPGNITRRIGPPVPSPLLTGPVLLRSRYRNRRRPFLVEILLPTRENDFRTTMTPVVIGSLRGR